METCRGHVSTRGGLPRRVGRIPPSPPWRRSKLHIACSDFYAYGKKIRVRSFRCSSFQTRSRWASGLLFGDSGQSKVRFATALSISRGIESTIRSAPLILLVRIKPTTLGFDSERRGCEQTAYRLLRLFCLRQKSQSALIPLLLLAKPQPLRWVAVWFWVRS